MKDYAALVAAAENFIAHRADYEDLSVEIDCLEDALRTGTREELLDEVNVFFAVDVCPFGDMDPVVRQLFAAADDLNAINESK